MSLPEDDRVDATDATEAIRVFNGENFFLSNFCAASLVLDGKHFATSEHAFQAFKTEDPVWFERIRRASTPGEAKKLGRAAPLRRDWESVKEEVMMRCLRAKFGQNPELGKLLLQTGVPLIEGTTWHDLTWGICTCSEHGGRGKNRLGHLLMKLRDELRGRAT